MAVGGAAALPTICSSPALAADKGELPVVNHPRHPAAEYAPGVHGAHAEPLNASVDCELHGRTA